MLKTLALRLMVIANCVLVASCSVTPSPSVSQRCVPPTLMSRVDFRSHIQTLIQESDSIGELKTKIELYDFNVRIRENGNLWATKEIPAAWPTSVVYDAIVRQTENGMEIVRAERWGKGP